MAEEKRTKKEKAVEAKAFLDGIMDDARRRKIPVEMTITLLGYLARGVIDFHVEKGEDRSDATTRIIACFMKGIGLRMINVGDDDIPDERDMH